MAKLVNSRIQQKYDTSTNWKTNNPILLKGEIGIESDTRKIKVGNGSSAWNSLSYISADSEAPSIPSDPTFSTIYFEDSASSLTGASLIISNYVVSTSINATQLSMTTPDGATDYQAEKISRKNEGKIYTYTYPSKTGTFALTNDFKTINGKSIVGSGDIAVIDSLPSYLYRNMISFNDGTVRISDNMIENRNLSSDNAAIVHENSFHVSDAQTSTKYKVNNIERVDGVVEYSYTLPNKSGTIALTSDISGGGGSSGSNWELYRLLYSNSFIIPGRDYSTYTCYDYIFILNSDGEPGECRISGATLLAFILSYDEFTLRLPCVFDDNGSGDLSDGVYIDCYRDSQGLHMQLPSTVRFSRIYRMYDIDFASEE